MLIISYAQTTDARVMVWDGMLYTSTNPTPVGVYNAFNPMYDPAGSVS